MRVVVVTLSIAFAAGLAAAESPAVAPQLVGAPDVVRTAPSPAPVAPKPLLPAPPTQAAIDKVGQGDRAFLAADYRTALFAYQDAVYLSPQYHAARLKLGRAYLALRYPAQAIAQCEQVLAADPSNSEARKLLEDARNPSARPAPAAVAPPAPAASATATAWPTPPAAAAAPTAVAPPAPSLAAAAPRIYRFVPDSTEAPRPPPAEPQVAAAVAPTAPQAATSASPAGSSAGGPAATTIDVAAPAASAAQHYRTALDLVAKREFANAVAELTDAIAADPRLAVAYAARASAQFGLGKYREAADDYRAALGLEPALGTPLYGLAECYRVLGDAKNAAEMYGRYAESRASDVREDLRAIAAKRAQELR